MISSRSRYEKGYGARIKKVETAALEDPHSLHATSEQLNNDVIDCVPGDLRGHGPLFLPLATSLAFSFQDFTD